MIFYFSSIIDSSQLPYPGICDKVPKQVKVTRSLELDVSKIKDQSVRLCIPQVLRVLRLISFRQTYPVFSLSDLEDLELLPAGAERHLPVDFVVDPFGVCEWTPVLPVRPEGSDELPPVDHAVTVVEFVCNNIAAQLQYS